jgi:hypothetical protein
MRSCQDSADDLRPLSSAVTTADYLDQCAAQEEG